ncbi:unnamed protein product [Rotaria magnacalcarata]|uniref:Uncharacterized protein n=2 Tax=Rotaria magnacalcarata TaxID=392030 RepID=A0A816D8X3_9BILA|nr:unnamed protein product [Rotaria magnacalcarata]CAF1631783.1 unnamed protein product [Rotaria magnacalcarata]CAF4353087.1 unnamed protein product [Rotaria magnacalcarata]CAF4814379.1 unnamed protein product [Rotaria magnacalcarata]
MTTENVSAQEAVNRLVGAHEITAGRINKLEGQLDELLKKFTQQNANSNVNKLTTISSEVMDAETSNASKIIKLESQIDGMCKTIQDYREENINSTRTEFQTMTERMGSIQALTMSRFDETTSEYEESKRQWSRMNTEMNTNMNCIMDKLDNITGSRITPRNTNHNWGRPFQTTTHIPISRSGHTFQTNLYPTETQVVQETIAQNAFPLNGVKHSIIAPPPSAAAEFQGKHSESPTQFLIRVEEYAHSVHAWDRPTLLSSIWQFLRGSALEWY